MILTLSVIIALSVISAILYNLGGRGHPYNTKYRDIGCALCVALAAFALGSWHWMLLPTAVVLFGALTCYWKLGPKSYWYNWALTGLGYALSWLPFCYVTHRLLGLLYYTILVVVFITIWSEIIDNVRWEERGRGWIIVAALPLIFIGG